jgi:hypothetical protein
LCELVLIRIIKKKKERRNDQNKERIRMEAGRKPSAKIKVVMPCWLAGCITHLAGSYI